MKEGGMWNYNN